MYSINGKRESLYLLFNIIPFIKADKGKHMAISQVMKTLKKSMQDFFDAKEEIESKSRRDKFSLGKEILDFDHESFQEDDKTKKEEINQKRSLCGNNMKFIEDTERIKIQELKNEMESKDDLVEIKIENEAFIYLKDMVEAQASDLFNSPINFDGKSIARVEYSIFEKIMDLFTSAIRQ